MGANSIQLSGHSSLSRISPGTLTPTPYLALHKARNRKKEKVCVGRMQPRIHLSTEDPWPENKAFLLSAFFRC